MVDCIDIGHAGLGLRRGLLKELAVQGGNPAFPDFFELAPENWLSVGGRFREALQNIRSQRPIIAHGLSLSLGGTDPIDLTHVDAIGELLNEFELPIYSEHLSASAIDGHLYDLAPIAFSEDMLRHIASRIGQVQDRLKRRISIENSSYYLTLGRAEMTELEFIQNLLEKADCELLLDINNVYVNSQNHRYAPETFIAAIPSARIRYHHIAGHDANYSDDGTIVDTHGADVCHAVFELLQFSYRTHGVRPTLLERDFNFPPLLSLFEELGTIRSIQSSFLTADRAFGGSQSRSVAA